MFFFFFFLEDNGKKYLKKEIWSIMIPEGKKASLSSDYAIYLANIKYFSKRASVVAQWVRVPPAKLDDLSLSHMVGET